MAYAKTGSLAVWKTKIEIERIVLRRSECVGDKDKPRRVGYEKDFLERTGQYGLGENRLFDRRNSLF